jgi:DNA repair protein RadC
VTGRRAPDKLPQESVTTNLREVDDQLLVAHLIGHRAAGRMEKLGVGELLDADDYQLARLGLASGARRRLLAAAEIARRFQPAADPTAALDRPRHYLPHLARLRAAPVEVLGVLALDARLGLLGAFCPVAAGGLMHVSVSAREVFAPAIACRAAAIVLAHNHPSGDPDPSHDDLGFTQVMAKAGGVLGIRVLDHLVVTRRAYFSFAEARLL